jgi:hypothetical protein
MAYPNLVPQHGPTEVCFVLLFHSTVCYRLVKRKNLKKYSCHFGRFRGPAAILADRGFIILPQKTL